MKTKSSEGKGIKENYLNGIKELNLNSNYVIWVNDIKKLPPKIAKLAEKYHLLIRESNIVPKTKVYFIDSTKFKFDLSRNEFTI